MSRVETEIESFECIMCLRENQDIYPRFTLYPDKLKSIFHWLYYRLNPAYGIDDYEGIDRIGIILWTCCNYCNHKQELCNYERLEDFTNKTENDTKGE